MITNKSLSLNINTYPPTLVFMEWQTEVGQLFYSLLLYLIILIMLKLLLTNRSSLSLASLQVFSNSISMSSWVDFTSFSTSLFSNFVKNCMQTVNEHKLIILATHWKGTLIIIIYNIPSQSSPLSLASAARKTRTRVPHKSTTFEDILSFTLVRSRDTDTRYCRRS